MDSNEPALERSRLAGLRCSRLVETLVEETFLIGNGNCFSHVQVTVFADNDL
jgi:hypothetical protein